MRTGGALTEYSRQGRPDSSLNLADCHKLVLCASERSAGYILLAKTNWSRDLPALRRHSLALGFGPLAKNLLVLL